MTTIILIVTILFLLISISFVIYLSYKDNTWDSTLLQSPVSPQTTCPTPPPCPAVQQDLKIVKVSQDKDFSTDTDNQDVDVILVIYNTKPITITLPNVSNNDKIKPNITIITQGFPPYDPSNTNAVLKILNVGDTTIPTSTLYINGSINMYVNKTTNKYLQR